MKLNWRFAFYAGFPRQSTSQADPDASIHSSLTEQVTQGASSLMAVGSVPAAAGQDQALLGGACQQTTAEATASVPHLKRGGNTIHPFNQQQQKRIPAQQPAELLSVVTQRPVVKHQTLLCLLNAVISSFSFGHVLKEADGCNAASVDSLLLCRHSE